MQELCRQLVAHLLFSKLRTSSLVAFRRPTGSSPTIPWLDRSLQQHQEQRQQQRLQPSSKCRGKAWPTLAWCQHNFLQSLAWQE